MFGTTRNDCAAGILAIVLGVTFVPTALAAEDWGFSNGAPSAVEFEEAPAPVETEAEKRWFENQSIAPPPGGSEPTADEATDNAIDLIEDGLVDTGSIRRVDLPSILEDSDAELYRKIFELQEKGRWKQADRLIRQLDDDVLLGHVYFQRYMHPTAYRSSYKELRDWMAKYADHPGSEQVYKLALRRRPKNYRRPVPPKYDRSAARSTSSSVYEGRTEYQKLPAWKRRYIRRTQRYVRIYVHRGQPTRALRLLNSRKSQRIFDTVSMDESRAHIASGYFHAGLDKKAIDLGVPAADRSGKVIPAAYWWAGITAWRMGDFKTAARQFSAMAESDLKSEWTRAAAAFWAARAHLVNQQPEQVNHYLHIAAKHPRTFYGLLAIRALGIEPAFDWNRPALDNQAWEALRRQEKVRRAIALIQVDRPENAEAELKRIAFSLSPEAGRAMVNVAVEYKLPSLALRIGRVLSQHSDEYYDLALYPLPDWEPRNGFTIDKALVFAVMRQESSFRTHAKSHAGARGLMQLMPRTASFMAGRRFRGSHRHKLFDPALNMSLGQKYVEHLLEDPNIDGDLFYTVAAYNGGPGNLRKWRRRTDYQGDPLLFIESIPLYETRDYVERVLTNLWIYRYRLGQPAPSLDAIASGEWPSYIPLDNKPTASVSAQGTGL
jgi:soluble lytic murein transglycosylase-like protein